MLCAALILLTVVSIVITIATMVNKRALFKISFGKAVFGKIVFKEMVFKTAVFKKAASKRIAL
jgi:hypothetical protein